MTAAQRIFGAPPTAVVGHRGAPLSHRENTPASFASAAAAGATWVELDARINADGDVVVHHDPTLPDGTPLVDLDAAACHTAGIPTLAAVLAGLAPGLGVDIEIKNMPGDPDHDASMRVVERCGQILAGLERPGASGHRPLLLSSFNPMVLIAAAELELGHPMGLVTVTAGLAGAVEVAEELGCAAVCPHDATDGLDADGIDSAHRAGLAVMVWTVDDVDRAADLVRMGADAICTNDPEAMVRAISPHRST